MALPPDIARGAGKPSEGPRPGRGAVARIFDLQLRSLSRRGLIIPALQPESKAAIPSLAW
jgi:hypothetical protein